MKKIHTSKTISIIFLKVQDRDSPVRQLDVLSLLWKLIKLQVAVADERFPQKLFGAVVKLEGKLGLSVLQSYP